MTVCALLEWDGTEKRGYQHKNGDWAPLLPKTDLQDNWLHKSCFPHFQTAFAKYINLLQLGKYFLCWCLLLLLLDHFILLTGFQGVFVQIWKFPCRALPAPLRRAVKRNCSTYKKIDGQHFCCHQMLQYGYSSYIRGTSERRKLQRCIGGIILGESTSFMITFDHHTRLGLAFMQSPCENLKVLLTGPDWPGQVLEMLTHLKYQERWTLVLPELEYPGPITQYVTDLVNPPTPTRPFHIISFNSKKWQAWSLK